ncbi:MAG TPA: YdcF family protein [Acetobacteraceae bacterium]|nr:YdcF family protein [Acetobacteraceae bacterium]
MSHFARGVLTLLIVPPLNLVLLAILGLVLMRWRWYRRAGTVLVAVSLALLLALSLSITGQALLVSLEQGLPLVAPKDAPPQAIVILSAEMEHTRGPGLDVSLGPLSLQRVRKGAELYRRTHLPILVSGGTLQPGEPPIAELMADSLRTDFGVPVQWLEARSHNTWENAEYSAELLDAQHIRSVYVVTHAWHEKRAVLAFRHAGLIATAAPVQLDDPSASVFPEVSGWLRSYYALHEWIGFGWYWLEDHLWRSNSAA